MYQVWYCEPCMIMLFLPYRPLMHDSTELMAFLLGASASEQQIVLSMREEAE